jgi:hypothetical protein
VTDTSDFELSEGKSTFFETIHERQNNMQRGLKRADKLFKTGELSE